MSAQFGAEEAEKPEARMSAMIDIIGHSRTEASVESPIVPLLFKLLSDFNLRDISYCYWKSSRRVHAVLAGKSDLDLLIAREDHHSAQAILLMQGFKLFPSVAHRDHPATLSFLGYDESGGQIVHVHLHFRLIAGESVLKNYRIPWEEMILARAISHPTLPIRILDPISEALLLLVRAGLELRRPDPIMVRHSWALKNNFARDREELSVRVDRRRFHELAAELLTEDCARVLSDALLGETALEDNRRLRRLMRKHFASYRVYNPIEARLRSVGRVVFLVAGGLNKALLHLPRPWGRRAPGGGYVVAFVGVDGSGKSTVVSAIREWLSSEIDVMPIYFGTGAGRPSLLLWPLKLLVPLFTLFIKTKPVGASHGKISNRPPTMLYSLLLTVWATAVAVEKRMKLLAARRGASRGMVVIADRYPQNEIPGFNDGPMLPRLSRVPHWLRRFEAAAYVLAYRLPPDLVIKLIVLPETSAKREPDMDPAVIRKRVAEVPRLVFPGARVMSVDAERPLPDVLRAVKREIWRLL